MDRILARTSACFGLFLVLSVLPVVSPAEEEEPLYRDRPLSAWIADLNDKSVVTRRAAVLALAKMAPKSQAAVAALGSAIGDTYEPVRSDAFKALDELGPKAKEAAPGLALALASQDAAARQMDDYYEWLPNATQRSVLGLRVQDNMIDGWLAMMNELEALLEGKRTFSSLLVEKNGEKTGCQNDFGQPASKA